MTYWHLLTLVFLKTKLKMVACLLSGTSIPQKQGILQSGYEPLNLENGSFLNSDNFDATNLRF